MKEKIIIGLSGGVDSAVSMKLLQDKGYDIEALFMKNWSDDKTDGCNAAEDLEYAIDVCDKLKIKLHTSNFSEQYWNNIFLDFIDSYKNGCTPNPDILCNKYIKFKVFLDYANELGAKKIATGHYAKINNVDGSYFLTKPKDDKKDQTYFLHTLDQKQLSKVLFPLSDMLKDEVKNIAKVNGFKSYNKKESMGICFIGNKKFKNFINKYIKNNPGKILDSNGNIIGKHNGMFYTTIGQREGIGIGGMKNTKNLPWYVYKKDLHNNTLYVCQGNENTLLYKARINIQDIQVITKNENDILEKNLLCQIRHLGKKYECFVSKTKENFFYVDTKEKVRAPAPGQSIVFFDKEKCLGGGIITND
tara:strand:+ start:1154 stop:2233 length:1080 start_codon:yes stop_codon:yes gene_type:complete